MCFVPICFVSRMRSKCLLLLLCIRLLLLPSAARCSSLPWSKRTNDQSLGLGLKQMWLVVAWLVAKISGIATQRIPPLVPDCVSCARVGLYLLLYATTSVIPYVIGSAGCGVFPLWFVMPCYAHGQVASVVCYAVLCHGRVRACNVCIQRVP